MIDWSILNPVRYESTVKEMDGWWIGKAHAVTKYQRLLIFAVGGDSELTVRAEVSRFLKCADYD